MTIFWIDSGLQSLDSIKQKGGLWLLPGMFLPYESPPDDDRFRAAYSATLHILPNFLKALGIDTQPG